ncbi:Sodium/sulfate symporter [Carpediemonas membranifera]|uniref:Sodium/sulfate symporter n=1 Tax=Carpediemonas membranifera TaxID=201153 RepID=A0A8J6E2W7_9EUKA|nr:Sodium/sulfate symporter [Carpediemonas membranifera]|eukprot:KAG9394841.1 Sodium/sulfate symporter [Carpediemonas membranifera]
MRIPSQDEVARSIRASLRVIWAVSRGSRPYLRFALQKRAIGLYTAVSALILGLVLAWQVEGRRAEFHCAAVAGVCACCWVFEVLPLPITALLPAILLPILDVVSAKTIATKYFSDTIFVFIGGFVMALAMQKWGLHKRIALAIVRIIGVKPRMLLFGVMFAVWFLSMWMSNTATAMAMLPSALAIIENLEEDVEPARIKKFSVGLFLSIAFAAGIGGIATTIGTPPNLVLLKVFDEQFPQAENVMTFSKWFVFGLPTALIFFFICYAFFAIFYCPWRNSINIEKSVIRQQYRALGDMKLEEKLVAIAFVVLAICWMTLGGLNLFLFEIPGWKEIFPGGDKSDQIKDGTVALIAAVTRRENGVETEVRDMLMDWETMRGMPWDLVLLFGGGFALAAGFTASGLDSYMADGLKSFEDWPIFVFVAIIAVVSATITSFSSNTATANMLLPATASLAQGINVHPLIVMIPCALSCSFAFMFPYSTPPNVIVFGSGRLRMVDMMVAGFVMNILGLVVTLLVTFTLVPLVWGFNPLDSSVPAGWVP